MTLAWYDREAVKLVVQYDALTPLPQREWLADLLPPVPALVVDIGAGSGRDARAFAEAGHEVVAVEPSAGMRALAERHASTRVRWVADSLPALSTLGRLGLAADVVVMSAVWQHVLPAERPRAFRKLVGLLRSGGLLAMTFRLGPDDGRGAHPVSLPEIVGLARDHGMQVVRTEPMPDALGRAEVSWVAVVLRLPDDGTGALPLLRHLILTDAKSATYKLGLLRALCRAADGSAGLAEDDDEHLRLPLGLVALIWLRLYLPLTGADLPQMPRNTRAAEGLGFAGPGWQTMVAMETTARDLRVGAAFAGEHARAVHLALREAADLICRMPATYLTFPAGGQILAAERRQSIAPSSSLVLDGATLLSFGTMRVPRHLWTAMQRFACWVEPALVAEWERLMRGYADSQGRVLATGAIGSAMTWSDPERDVAVSRGRALALLDAGEELRCVWSGKRLGRDSLDVDHCLPWSAWPCGDLWNLMPTDRRVNQHGKRDRLPSAGLLAGAADAVRDWWTRAYLRSEDAVLPDRFVTEARASLPGLKADDGAEDVFAAVELQRLRLRQNQGVPEWSG